MSPDLEKGRGVLDFPLFVRGRPLKIPRSASLSKPGLRPESEESPGNPVRPEIVPGGTLHSTSRDTRAVNSKETSAN